MNYQETLNFLYTRLAVFHREGKTAYKANLDNSTELDEYFGHPHRKYLCIHVAGTNGKGSVSHMLAAILQTAGYKTGLFTSPHLEDFRERIRVNGKEIPEQEVIDFVEQNKGIIEKIEPSFFELTSSLAFKYFENQNIDIAVIETGMGGRLDSTNIIRPILSIITNIELDHMEFLGSNKALIAGEKAGIIKQNTPLVIGETDTETEVVFRSRAEELKAPIYYADQLIDLHKENPNTYSIVSNTKNEFWIKENVQIDLYGNYQKKNLTTVLISSFVLKEYCSINISREAIISGLRDAAKSTGLRGRWQILGNNPLIICDTGHNAHGLKYVTDQLNLLEKDKLYIVFGVVSDKDLDSVLPLLPRNAYYFFTQADIPRAMDAETLSKKCIAEGLVGEVIKSVKRAYQQARSLAQNNDIVFIGGSTFVVAEIF